MIKLIECTRYNLCVDCDNLACHHCGDIGADCPKYQCDNDIINDCENCEFIKQYQQAIRNNEEL